MKDATRSASPMKSSKRGRLGDSRVARSADKGGIEDRLWGNYSYNIWRGKVFG
jgi:hypothetical protein